MGRVSQWEREKANSREKLYKIREGVLGVGHPLVPRWLQNLPLHPLTPREHFLQICAIGGVVPFEGMLVGVTVRIHPIRNTWQVYSPLDADGVEGLHGGAPAYSLHLWIRPRPYDDLFGRQHTAKHCDAELHDGWSTKDWLSGRKRVRDSKVLHRGKVVSCLEHAKVLFTSWDAVRRLGGNPEEVAFL